MASESTSIPYRALKHCRKPILAAVSLITYAKERSIPFFGWDDNSRSTSGKPLPSIRSRNKRFLTESLKSAFKAYE